MAQYGEPQTFTLDYAQMSELFELIEEALRARKDDERLKRLVPLRNELYRHLI
jgi:hypothetical protein